MKILCLLLICFYCSVNGLSQEKEYLIRNGDVEIAGTLILPEGGALKPLVILITGSGAQDRNETIYGFEVFRIIAEELASSGIPSFRFDDPGTGGSTGIFKERTLKLMASDVEAVMNYFKNDSQFKFSEFSILGHSQGGMIGAYVAARNSEVKQLILMASPTVPLKDVISEQVSVMQRMAGKSENDIAELLEFQEKAYAAVQTNDGWDSLKIYFRKYLESEIAKLPEAQQAMITDMDTFAEAQFNQQVQALNTPQMKSLLFYNAGEDIAKLEIPILGIFGGKDSQVIPSQNAETLIDLCKIHGLDCDTKVIDEANHLFQKANSGLINEYPFLPKEFVPEFLPSLIFWIKEN